MCAYCFMVMTFLVAALAVVLMVAALAVAHWVVVAMLLAALAAWRPTWSRCTMQSRSNSYTADMMRLMDASAGLASNLKRLGRSPVTICTLFCDAIL